MVKSGRLVVRWGTLPTSTGGAGSVLAYVRSVPEQGGRVLMHDSKTIETMTSEDFTAASRAADR